MNQEQALKLIRKRKGKVLLGEGSSRKVYEIDGYVIKKAKNKRGRIECSNEYWLYSNLDNAYKEHLCPLLYFHEGIVIMQKASNVDNNYFEEHIKKQFKPLIEFLFKHYGVDDFDLRFSFNWGIIDGKAVIVDYGHNYFDEEIDD